MTNQTGAISSKGNILQLFLGFYLMITFGGVINEFKIAPLFDIVALLVCSFIIVHYHYRFSTTHIIVLLFAWGLGLISSYVTNSSLSFYFGYFFHTLLTVLLLTAFNYNYSNIKESIYRVSKFICYLGVANFILYTFLPSIFVDKEAGNYSVKTIFYIFNYQPTIGHLFQRNQGIFWEPGVFQIFLNTYIYVILIEKRLKLKKIILPLFLMFTTFSTTGYIILSLILLYWFFIVQKFRISIIQITLFVIVVIALSPFVYENIYDKFQGQQSGSAAYRTYDFFMGIDVIKRHPIYGVGMDPEHYLKETYLLDNPFYSAKDLNIDMGNTNAFLNVAIMFGIPLGIFFILFLYKQNIYNKKRITFLIIFLSFMAEPLFGTMFVFVLLFSSIKIKRKTCPHLNNC